MKFIAPTSPGTEIKVIPDRDAPTIPKATTYHLEFLFPEKNVWLSDFPFVNCDITNKLKK